MCKLNPRIDFVFKKLFGTEESKDILKQTTGERERSEQEAVSVAYGE